MKRMLRVTAVLFMGLTGTAIDGRAFADDATRTKLPAPASTTNALSPQLTMPGATSLGIGMDFTTMSAVEGAANAQPGPRTVPGRVIPVPTTTSKQFRTQVAAPYRTPDWDANPKTAEDWRALVATLADKNAARLPALRDKLGVTSAPTMLGGVKAFLVQPNSLPDAHKDVAVLAIHGGGFVYNPGEAGTLEAVLLAGFGRFKVFAVDYRMVPDYPFPAATDDVMAAYKALLEQYKPNQIAVIGTSAGGNLALALCLRAKAEGVPLPAVIAPGTPEADMTGAGDTLKTNEWLDNVLVSADGYLANAQKLYAGSHDLRDPQLSPIFGDFHGMPPAILTSGTRDLFLSNTVRVHRKLRQAGVDAELQVYEGMSHAQYLFNADAPETAEVFTEIARFFDKHLQR